MLSPKVIDYITDDETIWERTPLERLAEEGNPAFDTSKPDGTMRKVMDVSRMSSLGWQRKMPLKEGIALAYQDMLSKI